VVGVTAIHIRTAAADDERQLAALDQLTWSPESAVLERPSGNRPFFDAYHTPGQFLVAEQAGQIAGYIRVVRPSELPSNAHVIQIQGLAVDPAQRGKGIGRALLDAACELASSQGARRITLRVLSSNPAARTLYESAGFAVEGVLPGEFHIAGRYVDDILMGRPLP
jgi:ribosomal protein S18 acetylase RimI-like enzyme